MVKVLVATARTQGARPDDYHRCVEGELVWIAPMCAKDRHDPDGGCGCGRGFAGLNSHGATTTAMVRTVPLDRADYIEAIRSSLDWQGFDSVLSPEIADALLELSGELPEGAVVEHRLEYVQVRERAP
ncbi:DUF7715 family protein [Prauserella cavernicola]|uniref:DUF7715 domain-containing protein n=1 Tax=Prauserella cavernicola TaxID=2800127 RepID=A0A934QX69_9PSEU|nr:hypothetical protein [Prauserella cavernicola]MBK1786938.1 hypothetical protein [Prauserella cavernicola]